MFPTIKEWLLEYGKMTQRSLKAAGYTQREIDLAVKKGEINRGGMRFGSVCTMYVWA